MQAAGILNPGGQIIVSNPLPEARNTHSQLLDALKAKGFNTNSSQQVFLRDGFTELITTITIQ